MQTINTTVQEPPESIKTSSVIKAVGVLSSNTTDFVRTMFSAYEQGTVVVPLRNRIYAEKLKGIQLTEIIATGNGTRWFNEKHVFRSDDTTAQITYTSGTEGEPKGIILTHQALSDVVDRLNKVMLTDSSIREYVGVPAYYSFGFGRFRACAAVGGEAYIPRNGFDPFEIAEMLQREEINAISAVPSLWRIILSSPDIIGPLGKRVRWIEIGSQYMSRKEKEEMKALFPNAKIVQHYGLTEASRSTLLDISETEGFLLDSVGKAFGRTEIRLTEDTRIQIRGPHVSEGRITSSGIVKQTDTEGWLTTADLGELKDGYLFFNGRADDTINCGGIKLFPEHIEAQLKRSLAISDGIAVARVPDHFRGDGLLVAFTPETGRSASEVQSATATILEELGVKAGDALHVSEVETLPKTETGKVQRRVLTNTFVPRPELMQAEKEPEKENDHQQLTEEQQKLVGIWEDVLGIRPVSIHMSFFDLGGDSLSSLKLMMKIEKAGLPRKIAQAFFEGKTIAEITREESHEPAAEKEEKGSTRNLLSSTSDAINATRGTLALWLLAIHWLPGVWKRMPAAFSDMDTLLTPAYRLGTPGFAIVFGLGVGFYFFHQLATNASLVKKNIRFAAGLLIGGILLSASLNYTTILASHAELNAPLGTVLFYSVLLYYLLAVISIKTWFRIISRFENWILGALCTSTVFFGLGILMRHVLPDAQSESNIDVIRLMMKANYNYFTLTGEVMLGIATGLHLRENLETAGIERKYALAGGVLFCYGIINALDSGLARTWFTSVIAPIWMLPTYLGFIILLLSGMMFVRKNIQNRLLHLSIKLLGTLGILSLPLYVGHGMVIPTKNLLVNIGVPLPGALMIPMLLFIGSIGYAARRIFIVYAQAE